jgi:NTE family protein
MGRTLALVLSGGGARGAFEVGVLSWLAEHRPEFFSQVRIVTSSSVGALNACYLLAHGMNPACVSGLVDEWCAMRVEQIMEITTGTLTRSTFGRLFGRKAKPSKKPEGVFKTVKASDFVKDFVDWPLLHANMREGVLDAFAVAATEIRTGRTHVFTDIADDRPTPSWPNDKSLVGVRGPITAHIVLASTSLPFLFPPVNIGKSWYCDGGLRQNTPLSPALRLGADKIFTISLKTEQRVEVPTGEFPGYGHLLGKLFNGLFLDRMMWDMDRLSRINVMLECVEEVYGTQGIPAMQRALVERGRRPYSVVEYLGIRPSEDLGNLASRILRHPERLKSKLNYVMRRVFNGEREAVADLSSYLLFDGTFATELIDMGRRDAAAREADIDRLLAA